MITQFKDKKEITNYFKEKKLNYVKSFFTMDNENFSLYTNDTGNDFFVSKSENSYAIFERDKGNYYIDEERTHWDLVNHHIKKYIKQELKKTPIIEKLMTQMLETHTAWLSRYGEFNIVNLEKLEKELKDAINQFKDRDNMRHLKNSRLDFEALNKTLQTEYNLHTVTEPTKKLLFQKTLKKEQEALGFNSIRNDTSFENLSDLVHEIVLIQKTKKMIQKSFSAKYRHFIRDEEFNIIQNLVSQGVTVHDFHEGFAKKMARYKSQEEFSKSLKNYIADLSGWNLNIYLDKAKELDIDIIHQKDNILTVRLDTYEQTQALGDERWCIAYNQDYFLSYKSDGDQDIYAVFDFNKPVEDHTSMVGLVIDNVDEQLVDGYWRNDLGIHEDLEQEEPSLMDYVSTIPDNQPIEYYERSFKKFIKNVESPSKKSQMLFRRYSSKLDVDKLQDFVDSGDLTYATSSDFKKIIENGENQNWKKVSKKHSEIKLKWRNLALDLLDHEPLLNYQECFEHVLKTHDVELIEKYITTPTFEVLKISKYDELYQISRPINQKSIIETLQIFSVEIDDYNLNEYLSYTNIESSEYEKEVFVNAVKTIKMIDKEYEFAEETQNLYKKLKNKKDKKLKLN